MRITQLFAHTMPLFSPRIVAVLAIATVVIGAYMLGVHTAPQVKDGPTRASTSSAASVSTTTDKLGGTATTVPAHAYVPVLTHIVIAPPADRISILRCTGIKLTAEGIDQNGDIMPISGVVWSSSDAAEAGVDQAGNVTGSELGRVLITAQKNEIRAAKTIDVIVSARPATLTPCKPRRTP